MSYHHRKALALMLMGMFWVLLWIDDIGDAEGWWKFLAIVSVIIGIIMTWIGHLRFTTLR